MSDRCAVRALLIEAAIDGPQPHGAGPQDGLRGLLAMVARTVLPRRLSVRTVDGRELTIEAANRRLMSITETSFEGAAPAAGEVLGGGALGPGDASAVAGALSAILAENGQVSIRTTPRTGGACGGQAGLSPAAILAAAGLDPASAEMAPTGAATMAAEDLGSFHVNDGAPDPGAREDPETERLAAWADATLDHLLSDAFPLAGSLETEGTLWLDYGREGRIRLAGCRGQFDVSLL